MEYTQTVPYFFKLQKNFEDGKRSLIKDCSLLESPWEGLFFLLQQDSARKEQTGLHFHSQNKTSILSSISKCLHRKFSFPQCNLR